MLPLSFVLPAEVLSYEGLQLHRGWRYARVGSVGVADFRTPLLNAIARGDIDAVVRELPADVAEARYNLGWTPLHYAARAGSATIVELLLAHGLDPNAATEDGRRPMHMALECGHHAAMAILLAWPRAHISEHMLSRAVELDDMQAVQMILKREPSCASDETVFLACQNGNAAIVDALLATGVPVNALHLAVSPNAACMTALLMRGVSPHVADKYGVTVAHLAAAFGSAASLRALIEFDPSVLRKTTKSGHSALDLAVLTTREQCVEVAVVVCRRFAWFLISRS